MASALPRWAQTLNTVLTRYPSGAFLGYPISTLSTFGVIYTAATLASVTVSPSMALAYVAGRLTARLSFPVGIAAAVPIAKAFPSLTHIKVSSLMVATAGSALGPPPAGEESSKGAAKIHSWVRKLEGPVDKYGAALLIGRRVVGLAKVAGFYAAIEAGMDVPATLQAYGFSPEIGETAGKLAAVTALNTLAFPLHVYVASAIAPALSTGIRRAKLAPTLAPILPSQALEGEGEAEPDTKTSATIAMSLRSAS